MISKQRIIYGRRIISPENFIDDVQSENNTPLNYGVLNDLILRMNKNTPDNEKALRGMP